MRRPNNLGLILRAALLLGLVLLGLWQGWRTQEELRAARIRNLGLADNSGRLATLRLVWPDGRRTAPFEALLLYEEDYARYRPYLEARRLSALTYLREIRPAPVRLSPPHAEAVYLSWDGVVLGVGTCPRGREVCTPTPPLPYRGLLELVQPLSPPMGAKLEVVAYGEKVP